MELSSDSNYNGENAEKVVSMRFALSNIVCRTVLLGDKFPVVDMLIEFEFQQRTFHFFVQVKGTILGPKGELNKRLEIDLPLEKLKRLANHFCPTYVIGVDLSGGPLSEEERAAPAYICTVRSEAEHGIYSIPIESKHELNKRNIEMLFNEVVGFWNLNNNAKGTYNSNFERN